MSQEFSTTESRILGALFKLDEILLNAQIRTLSGTVPETHKNTDVENQETTRDRSRNDPHPKVNFSVCQHRNLSDSNPEEASLNDSTTGILCHRVSRREILCDPSGSLPEAEKNLLMHCEKKTF